MLDISSEAIQQLKEFKDKQGPDSSIRIGILSGHVAGSKLGVTTDIANDKDEMFTFNGLEIVVDKALLDYCESISVEFVLTEGGGCGSGGGFKITPQKPL